MPGSSPHRPSRPRLDLRSRQTVGMLIVAAVTTVGALWFWLVEGFDPIDALYQSVITISTVGFTEVEPLDRSGRLFTVGLILAGVGAVVFAAGAFAENLIDSSISRITTRRKDRTLERLTDHTVICGFGRTGREVLRLLPAGTLTCVIDVDEERIQLATEDGSLGVVGDCTGDEVLRQAGLERASKLILCLSSDSDAISTTLSARVLNPNLTIVTRLSVPESASKLRLAGADQVVSPIEMGARRMVADATDPRLGSFLDALVHDESTSTTIRTIRVPAAAGPARAAELELTCGIRILGAISETGEIGHPEEVMAGDLVVVAGPGEAIAGFQQALG